MSKFDAKAMEPVQGGRTAIGVPVAAHHGRGTQPASVPHASRQRRTASHRVLLLSSCSGAAMLLLVTTAAPAMAQDSGDSCVMAGSSCGISYVGPAGATETGHHGDGNGRAGGGGPSGPDYTHIFVTPQTFTDNNGASASAIGMQSSGGNGGDGGDASTDFLQSGLSGGTGGTGGGGGALTLNLGQGVTAQAGPNFGLSVVNSGGDGGRTGVGGFTDPTIYPGATAGSAGDINVTIGGTVTSGGAAVNVTSQGGTGGGGLNSTPSHSEDGVDAGPAGTPGNVTVTVGSTGTVTGFTAGGAGLAATLLAKSTGGNGGDGSNATSGEDGARGGNGSDGTAGGSVTVIVQSGGSVVSQQANSYAPAIWAQSLGGLGGTAGSGPSGGATGGSGENGGTVTVTVDGLVQARNPDSPAVLAQSMGGTGANGGKANMAGGGGGDGGTGGDGGSVIINGSGGTIISGYSAAPLVNDNSSGVLAQSIGGGGGAGGSASGAFTVGGSGAAGANGGSVTIDLSNSITTWGPRSHGIQAQSIGGGGGTGGNASGGGVFLNIEIGGSGAAGGAGGAVQATNGGTIVTQGSHSAGMLLQSIGGGGGSGGAAYSRSTGVAGSASVSIGGTGGAGGAGSTIGFAPNASTTNSGTIVTAGNDAYGIVGQSIGGGGGHGGAAASSATTYSVPDNEEIPSVALSVSLAGSGGAAGGGNSVTLDNAGLIATRGAGGSAMVGQSIGGGGGTGGDSSAHASAQGSSTFNLTGTLSFGGKGGGGGAGGNTTVSNNGLIITSGESADGILVQSIGGGGGAGGNGDGQGKATGDDAANVSVTLNMGGVGGGGGNANQVSATNNGAIITLGDGATGIMAQAVGGGGGRGGGAAGTSSGTYSATVNIGANGGSGGATWVGANANSVNVTTGPGSAILTFGASAPGIVAQSIAGGGGTGGKAASTIGHQTSSTDGGNGTAATLDGAYTSIGNALASGGASTLTQYNSLQALTGLATQLLTGSPTSVRRLGDDADALDSLGGESGDSDDSSDATSITVNVGVGGEGGSGGAAGNVTVTNNGAIGTVGAMSDGILAQAIGGGGGIGGAAISSTTSGDVQGAIGVGGNGGGGGNGANVTVNNYGSISTVGGLSAGIVAQSIAGGGGIAGTSAAKVKPDGSSDSSVLSVPISIGASGGGGGNAGAVAVTNSGSIETRSHDAIGIIAQSIQGGGGIVRTRSSDNEDNNGGHAVATGGSYGINLTFGGSAGTPGGDTAGTATVTHTGASITTAGRNAYGILAQSIGGGGGLVLGGTPNGTNFFGTGTMTGSAGAVSVTAGNGTGAAGTAGNITTTGIGAVAIFAQSVGGGGGIAGDTGMTAQRAGFAQSGAHDGNGGSVGVFVGQSATLSTAAGNTPVIVAQSVGGGGGRVTNNGFGAYDGTAGGSGSGGAVTVDVSGQVLAAGAASAGIFAESVGQVTSTNPTGGAAIRVSVGTGATVQGGTDFNPGDGYGAAIYMVGGSTNQDPSSQTNNNVNNLGTITSLGGTGPNGTAIYSTGGWTSIYNQAGGTITGSISLDNGGGGGACQMGVSCTGGSVTNLVGGTVNSGAQLRLGATGTLVNQGTLAIGGRGAIATTAMTGNLVQGGTGRLVVDTDHRSGQSDHLDVQGSASIAGTVEVNATTVANRAVTVLTASNGVTVDAGLQTSRTQLFRFETQARGNSVLIQPRAEFTTQAAGLGQNQQNVANHLQALWDTGGDLGTGFTALAGINDPGSYARALNSLSGQTIGAIAAARYSASHSFVTTMLDGCPTYEQAGITNAEEGCGWARIIGRQTDQNATGDALGYKADAWTMQTGAQVRIAPNWFLGGSIAYESSDFRGDSGIAKVNGDSVLLGATLRYQNGPWQLSGAVDFGHGWYDSRRTVQVGNLTQQANANPTAWQVGAHTRIAYQIPFEGWYLQPRLDLHVNHVRSGGYTENGAAPFNLTVDGQDATGFAATPALEVGGRVPLDGGMVLRPYASAGFSVLSNGDWTTTARFAGQPNSRGFRATTPMPDTLARLSVGAELLSGTNWDFKLQYTADLGDGYASHAGIGRLAYRF